MSDISPGERAVYEQDPMDSIERYRIDDDFDADVRNALIYFVAGDSDDDIVASMESDRTLDMRRTLIAIRALPRERLTDLLLSYSLCPLHAVDYAICFDDDNPECKAIRTVWPGHDT